MRFVEYTDPAKLRADLIDALLGYVGVCPTPNITSKHEGRPLFLGKKYPALTVEFAGFSWLPRTSERFNMPGVANFKVRFTDVALSRGSSRKGEDRRVAAEKKCVAAMSEWWQGWAANPQLADASGNRASEVRLASADAGDEDAFGNARTDEYDNVLYIVEVDCQILL